MNFSVLISVYHKERAEYLRQCLDSVCNQTLHPFEVVIVKDGPLTESLDLVIDEFCQRDSAFKVVALPVNVGLGQALSMGLEQCSCELVARMDSDDICVADRFARQVQIFEQQPDLSVVGGWISEFSDDPNVIEACRTMPEENESLVEYAKSRNPMNHVTVMFKRSDVMAVGGYQSFYLMEDYWLWVRMIDAGKKIYCIQDTLVLVRGGSEMTSRRGGWRYAKSEIKLMRAMHRMGQISSLKFLMNATLRTAVRIMPNGLRKFVYMKALRG